MQICKVHTPCTSIAVPAADTCRFTGRKIPIFYLCLGHKQELPEGLFSGQAPLVKLDVSHNSLRALPAQLGEVKSLQRLVASNNSLSSVPHELGALRALKELDLRSALSQWPEYAA